MSKAKLKKINEIIKGLSPEDLSKVFCFIKNIEHYKEDGNIKEFIYCPKDNDDDECKGCPHRIMLYHCRGTLGLGICDKSRLKEFEVR